MQNKERNIDRLFSDKLKGHEVAPPPIVWDRIAEDMGHTRRRRRAVLMWSMSGAASLLLAFLLGWLLAGNSDYEQDLLAEIEQYRLEKTANVISTPIVQNVSIHVERPQLINYNQQFAAARKATINDTRRETSVPVNFMEPLEPAILSYGFVDDGLIAMNESFLNDNDRAIVEANLLALNDTKNESENEDQWSVGVLASPVYRFEQPSMNGVMFDAAESASINQNNVSTYYTPNVSGGLALSYQTKGRLSFTTGINYNNVAQDAGQIGVAFAGHNWINSRSDAQFEMESLSPAPETSNASNNVIINTETGLANINLPGGMQLAKASANYGLASNAAQNYDYKQAVQYVEVPLLMRYQLIDKKIGLHLLGGINTNVMVSNQARLLDNDQIVASGVIEGLNGLIFSSSVGMGMNYSITDRLNLNVEPTLKIFLNPMSGLAGFNSRPYAIGLFSGVSYQF